VEPLLKFLLQVYNHGFQVKGKKILLNGPETFDLNKSLETVKEVRFWTENIIRE